MNQMNQQITGIVLAGGNSSRMGSDKGLIIYKEAPLVIHAALKLSAFFSDVFISANSEAYKKFAYIIIHDEFQQCGPLGGIHATLKQLATPYGFVLSCDMPLITSEIIENIIQHAGNEAITIAYVKGKIEPLCAIYAKYLLTEIEERLQNGNYKLQDFIRAVGYRAVEFDDCLPFTNINSPSDLEGIQV